MIGRISGHALPQSASPNGGREAAREVGGGRGGTEPVETEPRPGSHSGDRFGQAK
jgi:hypothetical protein